MTTQLIKYEAACRAIAECKSVDEVKSWADKAAAMQAYGRMAQDKTMEVDAAEIRIRAERRLGEMLAATKAEGGLSKGAAGAGVNQHSPKEVRSSVTTAPTLADAGISKDLSSRAQKLAAVPEAEFESALAEKRERDRKEGARVSAKLEKAGAKVLKAKTAAEQEREQAAEDAHGDVDPLQMLEDLQQEVERLTAEVNAAQADDLKAEAIKWRRAYEHAVREQSAAMERAHMEKKRHEVTHRQLMRCGKAVGQADPEKIAPTVEAFVRQHKAEVA